MKSISESKLKAFSIGRMNLTKNVLTKRDKEDLKKKQEQEKTAEVYKDFVATFEGGKSNVKTFVRGDVINPDVKSDTKKGKLYKPKSRFNEPETSKPAISSPFAAKPSKPDRPTLKKKEDKKKSNLELFKEELKVMQLEREQRHSDKHSRPGLLPSPARTDGGGSLRSGRASRFEAPDERLIAKVADDISLLDDLVARSHENGDPMTTNLFLGNVNPKMDEQQLCELFGKYGPLASVKVMWPRTEEERARERNCAFVAFMTRKDADRALRHLQGRDVMSYEMKLGWGKTVPVPPHPVYVPPSLLERTMPPPPSGLPFNMQPFDPTKKPKGPGVPPDFIDQKDFEDTMKNSIIRVVVPTERNLLCLIHRMIEFVVREGPMFEAMIMNRELNNPMFRFLFDNKSPAHVYYRWRLYSTLQGENPTNYRQNDFRMFKNGSLWRPPVINPYSGGMEETDSEDELPMAETSANVKPESDKIVDPDKPKGEMKEDERDSLEDILRSLLPRQYAIGEAMAFCLDHADCAEEIVECIAESLSILETPLSKKIARLYLISDILHNASAKVANASFFRTHFESRLDQVMRDLHVCHQAISSRLRAEQFKQKVLTCFRAWDDWAIYPDKLLIHLQNIFLGLVGGKTTNKQEEMGLNKASDSATSVLDGEPLEPAGGGLEGVPIDTMSSNDNELDGDPLDGEPIDGMPLDGEPLDGVPLEEIKAPAAEQPRFVTSKWETVDPEDVEAQAMTTSKWDQLEKENLDGEALDEDSINEYGSSSKEDLKLNKAKRTRLREIELKVMRFQDELESGQREYKSGSSISNQVEQYRQKLLEREREKEERERSDKKRSIYRVQDTSSDQSSSGEEASRKKRRKKVRDSGGLVAYESGDSSDSTRRYRGHSSKKKKSRGRSRSRSRERHSRRSPHERKHSSRSPKRSKRSRSRERKKKRKSRH
ncbi:unnamed protein product [Clavelina lepadiformis]|uniref:U2 snRNP-associated SURP motif-containing protein n=1 Tax=Clavelina lepadiformis TaxID=159417 RepID=A0ABP0FN79_CLALP